MKSKRRLTLLDERIKQHTANIKYDHNDNPLSKLKYRSSEVKEDANSVLCKQRVHRGSLNCI